MIGVCGIPAAFLSLAPNHAPAILLELRHYDLTPRIDWPVDHALTCGDWLRALLW